MNDNLMDKLKKLDNVLGVKNEIEENEQDLQAEELEEAVESEQDEILDVATNPVEDEVDEIEEQEQEEPEPEQEQEQEQEEQESDITVKRLPAYLLDDQPEGTVNYVKWSILRGKSELELITEGCNPGTVHNCIAELKKEGLYNKPPKDKEGKSLLPAIRGKKAKSDVVLREKTEKDLRVYAKGSPAEELIEHFAKLPDPNDRDFEGGMKFGLSVAVLGIRMAQELSNLGVSQIRPLIDMTKSMREGEALAAKNAAYAAAEETAGQLGDLLGPALQDIKTSVSQQSKSRSDDPMREMIADTFKPMLQSIAKQMMPPGTEVVADQIASGWVKRKK